MTLPLIEGKDYYLNAGGLLVFTASYLQERGFCCGNGCTNCPFDYANVPQPLKDKLLTEKEKRSSGPQP